MSTGRIAFVLLSTATIHNINKNRSSPELGWLKTMSLYLDNEQSWRERGITPAVLHESAKAAFASRHKHKAFTQYELMKTINPLEGEVVIFEQSGDELDKHNLPSAAVQHWQIAYKHKHKPEPMCTNLGNRSMQTGALKYALEIFQYQLTLQPSNHHKLNNVGIANFMLATQSDSRLFIAHKKAALDAFNEAKLHDPIIDENYRTAEILHYGPVYGSPYARLQFTPEPTAMRKPLEQSLKANEYRTVTKSDIGYAYVPSQEVGKSGEIVTCSVESSYEVPNVANTLALQALRQLDEEQTIRPRM